MKRTILLVLVFLLGIYACKPSETPLTQQQQSVPPTISSKTPSDREWDNLIAKAKKEGTVVIYAGPLGAARQALIDTFRQKYGISLDIVIGKGEEVVARMGNERNAGIYNVDMGIHGMTTYFNLVKPKGMTVPIEPLLILPEVRDLSRWIQGRLPIADLKGHLVVLGINSSPHMLVNTDMVKRGDITTHSDLLSPK